MASSNQLKQGSVFQVVPNPHPLPVEEPSFPARTISNYGIPDDEIDFSPDYYTLYVMGVNGYVTRLNKPTHMIGFNIIQKNGKVYYQIDQVGFSPIEIYIEIMN